MPGLNAVLLVPLPIICDWTLVNAIVYPYAVYVPEAVYFKIVFDPEVVTVGDPVVVPE